MSASRPLPCIVRYASSPRNAMVIGDMPPRHAPPPNTWVEQSHHVLLLVTLPTGCPMKVASTLARLRARNDAARTTPNLFLAAGVVAVEAPTEARAILGNIVSAIFGRRADAQSSQPESGAPAAPSTASTRSLPPCRVDGWRYGRCGGPFSAGSCRTRSSSSIGEDRSST